MKVAILGCGPSALLAGHAAQLHGHTVRFLSKKVPSKLGGSQYLHKPIPDITNTQPDGQIAILGVGDAEGYAHKIYGDAAHPTSWDQFVGRTYRAWNLEAAYDTLWREFEGRIFDTLLDSAMVDDMVLYGEDDLVINTIPASELCSNPVHEFRMEEVTIFRRSDVWGGQNAIVYNGLPDVPWYRTSCIFRTPMTEFPGINVQVAKEFKAKVIKKPLSTTCDCWEPWSKPSPQFLSVGRYGKWKKGVLVTDAFDEVMEVLSART